ncbi:MAG TPA: glycosyltransferase family 2 protein [Spirochaetota bacterium]|nr:glycosyltransferase family 2 protein [Spirochaetota bacterium]
MKKKLSIIVPTFKEAPNIPELVRRIDSSIKNSYDYEIIIVDDNSQDGIERTVDELKHNYPVNLKIRFSEKGLSSAVIAGFEMVTGHIIVVMDADLSHPPEKITALADKIVNEGYEFVIGSRFVTGGSSDHFDLYRKTNAYVSKIIARPFTKVKDPMAGFFAFPASLLEKNVPLNPLGFKIGLELLVKLSPKKITEVPIEFQERLYGESKLTFKQQILYLVHIWRLFRFKYRTLGEFLVFSMIGTSGMIIDLTFIHLSYKLLLWLLSKEYIYAPAYALNILATDPAGVMFRTALVVGFIFALTSNFLLNRYFNFRKTATHILRQYSRFFIVSIAGFSVKWYISVYLFETNPFFKQYYLLAAFIGIMGGLTINFAGSKLFVFRHGVND